MLICDSCKKETDTEGFSEEATRHRVKCARAEQDGWGFGGGQWEALPLRTVVSARPGQALKAGKESGLGSQGWAQSDVSLREAPGSKDQRAETRARR